MILETISEKPLKSLIRKKRFGDDMWKYLNEGIFKTYDIDFTINYICKNLMFTTDIEKFKNREYIGYIQVEKSYNNEKDSFIIIVPSSYKEFKKLNKIVSLCGFYKSGEHFIYDDEYFIQLEYEKNIQDEIKGVISKNN